MNDVAASRADRFAFGEDADDLPRVTAHLHARAGDAGILFGKKRLGGVHSDDHHIPMIEIVLFREKAALAQGGVCDLSKVGANTLCVAAAIGLTVVDDGIVKAAAVAAHVG